MGTISKELNIEEKKGVPKIETKSKESLVARHIEKEKGKKSKEQRESNFSAKSKTLVNTINFNTKSKVTLELLEIRTNGKDYLTSKHEAKKPKLRQEPKKAQFQDKEQILKEQREPNIETKSKRKITRRARTRRN